MSLSSLTKKHRAIGCQIFIHRMTELFALDIPSNRTIGPKTSYETELGDLLRCFIVNLWSRLDFDDGGQ
ncbi:hypothetical protein PILCRDRAFT_824648 [Piloderma croceum F 1598]|uniref:Uncharacterized protein n=1 Tax=Piloderma croceum (strain F 1598) TaxID=765440 RepID=A0A0C3FE81_PILCF|nr:hypothetical protein PILCRDRAFT_824648 [Piloderma croceum F 1598]